MAWFWHCRLCNWCREKKSYLTINQYHNVISLSQNWLTSNLWKMSSCPMAAMDMSMHWFRVRICGCAGTERESEWTYRAHGHAHGQACPFVQRSAKIISLHWGVHCLCVAVVPRCSSNTFLRQVCWRTPGELPQLVAKLNFDHKFQMENEGTDGEVKDGFTSDIISRGGDDHIGAPSQQVASEMRGHHGLDERAGHDEYF